MRNENQSTITLRLKESKHLFVSSETPPFGVDGLPLSGIDFLVDQLSHLTTQPASRLVIQLPSSQLLDQDGQQIEEQLHHLCRYKIKQIELERKEAIKEGLRALQSGGIFLAIALLLATLVQRLDQLPEFFQEFAVEGLFIVGWVGLWHPIEIFIYGLWPYRREKKIYEQINRMEVKFIPELAV